MSPNMSWMAFFGQQVVKIWKIYLKSFLCGLPTMSTDIQNYRHTHTDESTTAIGKNAMRCILPKNINSIINSLMDI